MNGCIYRTEDGKCKQFSVGGVLSFCYLDGTCDCKIPSNADRIRQMSDEKLAETFDLLTRTRPETKDDKQCWLSWLKSQVEKGE